MAEIKNGAKLRSIIKDGHVYLHADDLALVLDERGEAAFCNDFGGMNGRLIRRTFGRISQFIREIARDRLDD